MAKVIITRSLEEEINKKFKAQSIEIFQLLKSLEDNPYKSKEISTIGKLVIKEIKYQILRAYNQYNDTTQVIDTAAIVTPTQTDYQLVRDVQSLLDAIVNSSSDITAEDIAALPSDMLGVVVQWLDTQSIYLELNGTILTDNLTDNVVPLPPDLTKIFQVNGEMFVLTTGDQLQLSV